MLVPNVFRRSKTSKWEAWPYICVFDYNLKIDRDISIEKRCERESTPVGEYEVFAFGIIDFNKKLVWQWDVVHGVTIDDLRDMKQSKRVALSVPNYQRLQNIPGCEKVKIVRVDSIELQGNVGTGQNAGEY